MYTIYFQCCCCCMFSYVVLCCTLLLVVYFLIPFYFDSYTTIICFSCCYSLHSSAYTIDLYNRDLQATIILFTRNMSSHKTDWILFELPLLALSCLLYRRVSSLIKAPEGECLCLRKISINVNKLFTVLLLPVYLFICFFYTVFCCCLFTS